MKDILSYIPGQSADFLASDQPFTTNDTSSAATDAEIYKSEMDPSSWLQSSSASAPQELAPTKLGPVNAQARRRLEASQVKTLLDCTPKHTTPASSGGLQ